MTTSPTAPRPPFAKGVLLSLGIVSFGFLLLAGLYLAPHPKAPPAPVDAAPMAPNSKLRLVSCDVQHRHLATDPALTAILKIKPDYVLLQNVNEEDVVPIAEALGLQKFYHPTLYQPAQAAGHPPASSGFCLLSNRPAFDEHPINATSRTLGVAATYVIEGRKFAVACVALSSDQPAQDQKSLLADWHDHGAIPIALGGQFPSPLTQDTLVQPQTGFFEALTPFTHLGTDRAQPLPPQSRFYLSPGWACTAGGVVPATHPATTNLAWIEATSVGNAGPSTTQAAPEN